LLYNNIGWSDVDLTALTGGPNAQPSPLVAFTTSPTLHVYYTDWNQHIRQLHSDNGTSWQDQDLTSITGGTISESAPGRTAGFNLDNFQYLYFVASTGHVHQFLYNNSSWSDEDLTALSKSTLADARSDVQAVVVPATKQMYLFYISTDNHIVELTATNNKKWAKTDLSKKILSPGPQSFRVAAFTTPPHNELHVFYVGYTTNFHVLQLYKPQSQPWVYEDMTALTNGGIPESFYNDIAGFSFQNNQYLYYVAQ
jgi:Fungal fucose-specific lectin